MSRIFARTAVLGLAFFATIGCRSAFAPDPVARLSAPPQTQLAATVKREVALRTGPDKLAHVVEQLPAGAAVTASDRTIRGFRRVRTADGRTGYVEEAAIEVGAAAAAPAPAPQPAAPAAEKAEAPAADAAPAPSGQPAAAP